jgi:hypothetical protein
MCACAARFVSGLCMRRGSGCASACRVSRPRWSVLAEAVRFELTGPFGPTVFKTVAIDHSATLPCRFESLAGMPENRRRSDAVVRDCSDRLLSPACVPAGR